MRRGLRLLIASGLGMLTSEALAAAPHITLRVEQPVYAGMPVWLDVMADDPCIGVHYSGDVGGGTESGWAEVKGPGGKTPEPGFHPTYYPHSNFATEVGACPSQGDLDQGRSHRIPLHLVADLRLPGQYTVRWRVPPTKKLGDVAPTDWLTFVVQPVSTAQREAWLSDLVARPP